MTNRLLSTPDFSPGLFFCRADRPVPDGSVSKAMTDDLERLFITSHKANVWHFRQAKHFTTHKNLLSPKGKFTQPATGPMRGRYKQAYENIKSGLNPD